MNWATDVENKYKIEQKKNENTCKAIAKSESMKIKNRLIKNGVSGFNYCHIWLSDDVFPYVKEIVNSEGYIIERVSKIRILGANKYVVVLNPMRWRSVNKQESKLTE